MMEHFPEDRRLLICLDDIHNIADDEQKIRDALEEVAETLGSEITLVSAGRLAFGRQVPSLRVSTFREEQTVSLFQEEAPGVDRETAEELHDRLGGHPYYLGLLADIDIRFWGMLLLIV